MNIDGVVLEDDLNVNISKALLSINHTDLTKSDEDKIINPINSYQYFKLRDAGVEI